MCRSNAEGGRRCSGCGDTRKQSAARADRRRRARLRADAHSRMGTPIDEVVTATKGSPSAADRAWERHERFLQSIKATPGTNPEIARLQLARLESATMFDPSRAWVREAMLAGVASGDVDPAAVRRAFEEEVVDERDAQHLAVVLDAVVAEQTRVLATAA